MCVVKQNAKILIQQNKQNIRQTKLDRIKDSDHK